MNQVNVVGRMGEDPIVKNLDGGKKVVNFSVAVSENYTNGKGEKVEATEWFRCVAFDKTAEIVCNYSHRGNLVQLTGKQKTREYVNKEGVKTKVVECHVFEFRNLTPKGTSSPASTGAPATSGNANTAPVAEPVMAGADDSDLPF